MQQYIEDYLNNKITAEEYIKDAKDSMFAGRDIADAITKFPESVERLIEPLLPSDQYMKLGECLQSLYTFSENDLRRTIECIANKNDDNLTYSMLDTFSDGFNYLPSEVAFKEDFMDYMFETHNPITISSLVTDYIYMIDNNVSEDEIKHLFTLGASYNDKYANQDINDALNHLKLSFKDEEFAMLWGKTCDPDNIYLFYKGQKIRSIEDLSTVLDKDTFETVLSGNPDLKNELQKTCPKKTLSDVEKIASGNSKEVSYTQKETTRTI